MASGAGVCTEVRTEASSRAISGFDAATARQVPEADPDALYRDREAPDSALRAAAIWQARAAAAPTDFEARWKLARTQYWLGTNGLPAPQRRAVLDAGIEAGRQAAALQPQRPEGHFWMAASMGALAESFGLRQGLKYRAPIRNALERVLAIDPAYLLGSADRGLGRWYYKVPGWLGGSAKKSEEYLRKALAYDRNSVITRVFLAETLVNLGRKSEARAELQAAIIAPPNPDWAPEDRAYKKIAADLLSSLAPGR